MSRSRFLSDLLGTIFERRPAAMADSDKRSVEELCQALLTEAGEVSGLQLARAILTRYTGMGDEERRSFFRFMTEQLDVDAQAVEASAKAYGATPTPELLKRLIQTSEPKRQELLRRINQVPGATAQLVAMRLDLLGMLADEPDFERIDLDFVHLFSSWFNRGFLVLRSIDWDTPANILEKVIQYEAVHAIDDWSDLRRRIEPDDRRCFAFFHPAMPDEPLIFVEVALCRGVPDSIQQLLAEDRSVLPEAQANTAVFYSISNCQQGLRGISFGNSLIKQVVEDLSRDLPHIKTFVTLSPLPGFTRWLRGEEGDENAEAVLEAARAALEDGEFEGLVGAGAALRHRAAHYLVNEKGANGLPLDAVARFHLGNGALIHDVHAMADVSANGLQQSCGVMVNYLYDLSRVERYHEEFVGKHKVARSRAIGSLLRASPPESLPRIAASG